MVATVYAPALPQIMPVAPETASPFLAKWVCFLAILKTTPAMTEHRRPTDGAGCFLFNDCFLNEQYVALRDQASFRSTAAMPEPACETFFRATSIMARVVAVQAGFSMLIKLLRGQYVDAFFLCISITGSTFGRTDCVFFNQEIGRWVDQNHRVFGSLAMLTLIWMDVSIRLTKISFQKKSIFRKPIPPNDPPGGQSDGIRYRRKQYGFFGT